MSLPVSDCRRATSEISLEYFENECHSVTNAHPPPPTFCVPLVHSSIRSYYLRIANSFFTQHDLCVCYPNELSHTELSFERACKNILTLE